MELKEEIVRIAKKMYLKGMVNAFEGNISVRAKDRFLITPSQMSKDLMTADMIIELDGEGQMLSPDFPYHPSMETRMHLAAHALRPDINAAIHNHSPFAASFALTGRPIASKSCVEAIMAFGEIPLCAFGRPGTDDIYKDFPKYLPDYDVVLLGNHGIFAVGGDLNTAYALAEAAESIAKTLWIAGQLGGEAPLPDSEVDMLRRRCR
jgi:L-fuculose-phosphate aldolase